MNRTREQGTRRGLGGNFFRRHAGGLFLIGLFLIWAAWMASRGASGCPPGIFCPR